MLCPDLMGWIAPGGDMRLNCSQSINLIMHSICLVGSGEEIRLDYSIDLPVALLVCLCVCVCASLRLIV